MPTSIKRPPSSPKFGNKRSDADSRIYGIITSLNKESKRFPNQIYRFVMLWMKYSKVGDTRLYAVHMGTYPSRTTSLPQARLIN